MKRQLARRQLLKASVGGLCGISSCGWLPALAEQIARSETRRRQCVLLWMSGGPSQLDTFDMKPDHANGGEYKETQTNVPGLRICEHLPRLSQMADQLALVRGLNTREGDHERGTYLMRTGQRPGSPTRFPCIGSSLAKHLGGSAPLPSYFSINPVTQINPSAFMPGFLGPRYAAATVGGDATSSDGQARGFAELRVNNLQMPDQVTPRQAAARVELWKKLQHDFLATHPAPAVIAQDTVYRRAMDLMTSDDVEAFDLSREPDNVRRAYGSGQFGQGCLLARRLIERGVPIVEVTLGNGLGWDTHQDNFTSVRNLCGQLDQAWSTLMTELSQRDLLQTTTLIWMGEFGRTPQINDMAGRDHFPNAWTCVFGGGGIAGGQAYGATSADGMEVVDGKVNEGDVLATLCAALGIDPDTENVTPMGRPHRIAEGTPIREILS